MVNGDPLTINVKPRDGRGRHLVVSRCGNIEHKDRLDVDSLFHRKQWRESVISRFDLSDDAHEWLESQVLSGAEAADAGPVELFRPVITMLNTVTPKPVEWLWPNKLAIGKNNLCAGDPGLGKSLWALDVAARVSRGDGFPDAPDVSMEPGGIVILTMEDDDSDTIVPRLLSHNADLSRIAHVKGLTEVDGDGQTIHGIDLASDIQSIRAAVEQVPNCKLVIVDTISDYMGTKTDAHKNRDVRSILNPLAAMANECRVANLCISHIRKSEGRAIHAAMGSIGFVGQCRVAWAITRCHTNPRRRLMTCIKNNLADDTSGLAFTVEPYGPDNSPVLCWEAEPVRMNADQAMDQLRRPGPKPVDRNNAAEWLREQLADGERPASEILEEADADELKPWTVRRAFNLLGCQRRKGGFEGGWLWALPEDDSEGNSEAQALKTCHLRNLRMNPEDNTLKAITSTSPRAKVTNCEGSRNGHSEPVF